MTTSFSLNVSGHQEASVRRGGGVVSTGGSSHMRTGSCLSNSSFTVQLDPVPMSPTHTHTLTNAHTHTHTPCACGLELHGEAVGEHVQQLYEY